MGLMMQRCVTGPGRKSVGACVPDDEPGRDDPGFAKRHQAAASGTLTDAATGALASPGATPGLSVLTADSPAGQDALGHPGLCPL